MKCKTIEQKKMRNNGDGTSSVRKHEQQSQERKMMQKKLPKTETKTIA